MNRLPSPSEVATIPYRAPGQVGAAEPVSSCIAPAPGQLRIEATPSAQERLRIEQAQQFATGRGQTVAVIDSGVDPHPLLAGRLDDGGDYILGDTALADCEGHGTVVAGIIAAAPDPATGFVGVAPEARILSIRQSSTFYEVQVPDPDRPGQTRPALAGDTTSMARAIVAAVQRGATVINISEAACYPSSDVIGGTIPDRDLQAAVRYAADSNVVVVAAAANTTDSCAQNRDGTVSTLVSPAWFDEDVLAVAATNTGTGEPAPFSIRGPWVDVAAPGTEIVSLAAAGAGLTATLTSPEGVRGTIQGTSFATPYVAGLAALVRERYPQLDAREVIERIERTSQETGGTGGHDNALGHGVVDPVAALTEGRTVPEDTRPEGVEPARLENFAAPERQDALPLPRTVALAGAAAGLGLLGLTLLVVHITRRHRRSS
jgi:membrane-anchored mycosin MYCP